MILNTFKRTPEERRIAERYKHDSLLPRSFLAVVLVIIFSVNDYTCLYSLFD